MQDIARALSRALFSAGVSRAARIEMIAMTTRSSISVKADLVFLRQAGTRLRPERSGKQVGWRARRSMNENPNLETRGLG
jgi:hypothetical protein